MPFQESPAPGADASPEAEPTDVYGDVQAPLVRLPGQALGEEVDFDAALGEALAAVERIVHKPDGAAIVSPEPENTGLRQELDEARRELARAKNELGRAQADLAVLRRLTQRQETDLPNQAVRRLLVDLLPALDHLDAVCQHLLQQDGLSGPDRQAVEMLDAEWKRGFQRIQLEPYDAVGKPFDSQHHEVIATLADNAQPAGVILRQAGRGYFWAGKLLRMASVVVNAAGSGRSTR